MAAKPTVVDPDAVDENPEELMGEVIPDPWNDKTQIDWPNNEDEIEDEIEEVPADETTPDAFVDNRDNVEVID